MTTNLIDAFNQAQQAVYDHVGYVEGYVEEWCVIPIDDQTNRFWKIVGTESDGVVRFASTVAILQDDEAEMYYEYVIYTQRFLPKWVYRGATYTMIVSDTRTDGNKVLAIFSNNREVK